MAPEIEFHKRDDKGKYKKDKNIKSISIQEDVWHDILFIEFEDGSFKRYLLQKT